MGYFTVPAGGTGHTHANKAVLDVLQDAGSGAVISAAERAALEGSFAIPPGTEALWDGNPPATLGDAVTTLAVLLSKHAGIYTEPNP